MASTFKNAGMAIHTNDDSSAVLYTAGSGVYAVIHALFITNHSDTTAGLCDVAVTVDGGTTYRYIAKKVSRPQSNTVTIDKPINLEPGDKLKLVTYLNEDSTIPVLEAFASILEVS